MTNKLWQRIYEEISRVRDTRLQIESRVRDIRLQIEREQKWDEESQMIPFISFPSEWKIQMYSPVMDALVRFKVMLPSGNIKSIYLDTRNSLSCRWVDDIGNPIPYWEVYPVGEDVGRCDINDIDELLRLIGDES